MTIKYTVPKIQSPKFKEDERTILSQRDPLLNGYLMSGQDEKLAVRELGRFVAAPGHKYAILSSLRSDDSNLGKMNPTLHISISSDYLEGEDYTDVAVEVVTVLGIIGLIIMTIFEFRNW